LILGKAAIRRQVACPKPIDDKGFSLFLGSAMIHLWLAQGMDTQHGLECYLCATCDRAE